jgi:hypothetical protein
VRARNSRSHAKRSKAMVFTLAVGAFTVAGGGREAVTLHLTKTARVLLAHARQLRVRATVVAHDAHGTTAATHTAEQLVVLRATHRM